MRRRSFLGSCALLAPFAASPAQHAEDALGPERAAKVRRLSKDKTFTLYRAGLEPAYTVMLDDPVLVECTHGLPARVTRDGKFIEAKPGDPVNPGTGPIAVDGILAGDTVAIDLLEIRVGDWGYSGGRVFELADGFVTLDQGVRLPLHPMIGQIGIVPASGEMDSRKPADTGGNMDCREIRAGSTLVMTAQVDGALVGIGDPHALQGDGEIGGQGIETDAEVLVRFRRLHRKLSPRPVIVRPEFVATLAAHKDLGEAAWLATDDMVRLVAAFTGRDEKSARMLVNLAGNLRVNQIVDSALGARMELPSSLAPRVAREVLPAGPGRQP